MTSVSALAVGGPFDGCTFKAPSNYDLYLERTPNEKIRLWDGKYTSSNMIFLGKPETPGSFSVYRYDSTLKKFSYQFAWSQGISRIPV